MPVPQRSAARHGAQYRPRRSLRRLSALFLPRRDDSGDGAACRRRQYAACGLGLMIVDVEGMRPDIPATGGFLARDIAARCRFQNGVLTEFRWTKGPNR